MPVVTVLGEDGRLLEDDQRAVVRHVVQDGYGADIVFAVGTTGEWHRLSNLVRQQVMRVCAEEVAKLNSALPAGARPVEAWAGITAHTPEETLENLRFAALSGSDAAVLAPLSIRGLRDVVRFVARGMADLLDQLPRRIPVYLYGNADIAADPKVPHIRTRQVKALSRLDFVRGIKVSAPRKVMGHYTKAAASFNERGEFGIYVGDALQIFEIFRPRSGALGVLSERWQRWRLRGGLPIGVVALSEAFGSEPDPAAFETMVDRVRAAIAVARPFGDLDPPPAQLIGTSGTITTLAAVHLGLRRYERKKIDGLVLDRAAIAAVSQSLRDMSNAARAAHPCIGPGRADLVVAAVGKAAYIPGIWIRDGAVVIDVGINRLPDGKLAGDVEFAPAAERASWITPVPGGVGPMTIAMLLSNTVDAALRRKGAAAG